VIAILVVAAAWAVVTEWRAARSTAHRALVVVAGACLVGAFAYYYARSMPGDSRSRPDCTSRGRGGAFEPREA